MIKKSFLLSLCSLTCASAALTTWNNATLNNLWNDVGNWNTGAIPVLTDQAYFPIGGPWASDIALLDAQAGSISVDSQTTITSLSGNYLELHPTLFQPVAILNNDSLIFQENLVFLNGNCQIINNGNLSVNGPNNSLLYTCGITSPSIHFINVENNGILKLTDSLFLGGTNTDSAANYKQDSATITGGTINFSSNLDNGIIFAALKNGALDQVNIIQDNWTLLGVACGTFTILDSTITVTPGTYATFVNPFTENTMVFDGVSFLSMPAGTLGGTGYIGPGPVKMLNGTIDSNMLFVIDKIILNPTGPSATITRQPQTSIFSGGTVISSSLSGTTYIAGTAIINNYFEQSLISVGQGYNPLEFYFYAVGGGTAPSLEAAESYLYANGDINSDVEALGPLGTLLGKGTITGDVIISKNAFLNPGTAGAPIGTLTVNGNLNINQDADTILDVTTAGFDFVNVLTGNLNIVNTGVGTPTLTFNVLGVPPTGTFFPLFEALSGISGQFDVTIPPSLIDFTYNTTDTLIYLSRAFIPVPTSGCAITPNQIAVETALNLLNGNTSACLQEKIDLISELACPIKRAIYDTLEPSEFKGQQIANEEIILAINADLISRMNQKKRGFRPFLHAGYRRLNQNSYSQYSGFHTNAGYQLLGFQRGFENAQIMAALGASEIYNSYKKTSSSSNTQQMIFGLGVAAFTRHFQMNLDGMFASNYNHTTRDIPFYGLKAHSSHGGYTAKGALDLRYRFLSNSGEITPYDTVSYLYDHESGFTEEGAECLNLQVQSSSRQVLRNEAGLHFQAKLQDMIKPYLDLAYVYEHRQGGTNYETNFISTTPLMTIEGIKPSRNYAKLAFGVVGYKGPWGYRLNLDGMYSNKTKQAGGSFALDRRF